MGLLSLAGDLRASAGLTQLAALRLRDMPLLAGDLRGPAVLTQLTAGPGGADAARDSPAR
eukprot:5256972-Pyramimonas_sp.AAC.1